MAKSKTHTGKPAAASSRAAAKKAVGKQPASKGSQQAERLVEVQANKLILEALREVSVLLHDKMMDADRDIEALKKEREANKTFASYRDVNALRKLNAEIAKLAASARTRLAEVRKEQDRLILSIKDKG